MTSSLENSGVKTIVIAIYKYINYLCIAYPNICV